MILTRNCKYRIISKKDKMDSIFVLDNICSGANRRIHYVFKHSEGFKVSFTDLSILDVSIEQVR
jgi:hypothetical protein